MKTSFKKYKFHILFILLILIISASLFYYFKVYKKNLEEPDYYRLPDSLFYRIKENPEYLVEENLLQVNSVDLLEYFRSRIIYYTYSKSEIHKNFEEEIKLNFPGERGRVLLEILNVYRKFEKEKEQVRAESDLDSYEKIVKIEMIKKEIFGEKLSELLFPKKDSEVIDRFYAYSERYLKKHFTDMPRSKKNHLSKARKEIYASDYEQLYAQETFKRKFNLELKINERELSILNEYEKTQAMAEIMTRLKEEN